MRALPYLQVVDRGDGVAEYSVTSKAGWLSFGWLDALLLGWFIFLNYGSNKYFAQSQLATLCPIMLWGVLKRQIYRRESLLVMESLGVQLSSQNILQIPLFPTQQIVFPLSGRSKTFIPASSIQDIVLLEGIQGWSIIWYLAIAQRDKEGTKLHVTFEMLMPYCSMLFLDWQRYGQFGKVPGAFCAFDGTLQKLTKNRIPSLLSSTKSHINECMP